MVQSPSSSFDLEYHLREIERLVATLPLRPDAYLGPEGAAITDIEWYALAAIKKTASLSHAFCTLARAKNTLAAAALVRLQLDTAMRMFGLTQVEDIETAGTWLMNDNSYRKLKARTGEALSDAFLHRKLDEKYPGLSEAYEAASAYVHLSGQHIKTGLWSQEGSSILFFDLKGTDDARPDEWFADIIDAFDQATRLTAELIAEFRLTRSQHQTTN
ncbi:hypothetical protein [Agrobacterium cavarae]|uniref:hypothetical protein n=1 Tax=Agrobacterium cavarae TaxID=2528239 RepID=UPI003EE55DD5